MITDFRSGVDVIDLTDLINPEFSYRGTGNFTGAREVRYETTADGVDVYIDSNGDTTADLRILLEGVSQLSEDDFLL